MEQPPQLLSPNGENGIYSTCSEAFDEILSHLPEAANPAPKAELDVLSDTEADSPTSKKDKSPISSSTTSSEKIKQEEEDVETSRDFPEFIQDWKSADLIKKDDTGGDELMDGWKVVNGDATEQLDLNLNNTTKTPTTTTIEDKTSIGDDVTHVDGSMQGSVIPEIDQKSCATQANESSRQLHQSPWKPTEGPRDENTENIEQTDDTAVQQETVFTVQFQVSASFVELPEDNSSDEDDVTSSKNGSEETVMREDQRSGDMKSSPDDVISIHDDDGKNLIKDGDVEEKTYIYEIFQPMKISENQIGSTQTSREAQLTRVMMTIRDEEVDGCIERRSLTEVDAGKDLKEIEDGSIGMQLKCGDIDDDDEVKVKQEDEVEEDPHDDDEINQISQNISKFVEGVFEAKSKEEFPSKLKSDWKGSITSITPDTETNSKKSRTPSSSTPIIIKGDSTKSIREEEMPAPNSTKILLAKFKSLERENSLQRLDKDKHPRPTRSSCMTLSTSSLSGSFDRHSHSSGKQLVGRHQVHIGAELTYPPATRSPSESVCSSDWDTESYGSDILQQHLIQSTQHLSSKDGEDKEESVLLTKSLLAQWKLLEEHERRLKQLEKTGFPSEGDAKIRSRSLGRLQSSIDKRILETPDDHHHPFETDVLNNSACLSKSLTLPKTSKPSQMRRESPGSLKDQYLLPSCTRSDSTESLQHPNKAKDLQQYLPPPFVTRYVLAKFKELENKSEIDLSIDSNKKAYKWEVKEAKPMGAYRGSSVEFRNRKPASYDPFYRRSYSEEPRRIHFEMKPQDSITEEIQPQTNVIPRKERSPKHHMDSFTSGFNDRKQDVYETSQKVDCNIQSKKKGNALEEARQYVMKRDRHDPLQPSKKVVKSLLSYFNSLEEDKEMKPDKTSSGKKLI